MTKKLPMIVELINPSDAVTFICKDVKVAGIACVIIGGGWFGLMDAAGEDVIPLMAFGGYDAWAKENEIGELGEFIGKNADAIAEFLESVAYGHIADREAFDEAIKRMTPDKAEEHRKWWNDRNRSSMNDIVAACLKTAKALRKKSGKLQSSAPIVLTTP